MKKPTQPSSGDFMLKFSTNQVYRCINFLLKTVEDDDFNDDDAQVIEGEEINRESHTFDVFVDEEDDF